MSASLTVDRDVIVVGGGPAGLAAAWHASRRGFRVTVLERSSSLGGMAASVLVDEVRADLGSHRLHPATPGDVMADLQELLGGSLQVRNRNGRVRVAGRWVGFPLSPANLLRTMPLSWAARVSADALLARRRRSPNPDSYAAALRASLGPTVYDSLYGPYARKLWGVPGEQIDPEQARVRVAADTAARVAARMIRRGISSRRQGSPQRGTHFLYPAGGFGEIPRALAEAARSLEATVHTGAAVTRIDTGPDSTTTRVDPAPGSPASTTSPGTGRPLVQVHTADGRTWQAPTVCSTLPLSVLAGVINPAPPQPVCQQAQSLVTRGMVLVYLTHRPPGRPAGSRVRWTGYDAHYLPGADTPVSRISEPTNYRDCDDDPADRSVVCAEIPCTPGDDLWTATEQQLCDIVLEAMRRNDLPPPAVSGVRVIRLPSVYPVYARGFGASLAAVDAWVEGLPGVTTLGRAGLFAHDNTHHALVMGQAFARCLRPDATIDAAAWQAERDSFRGHVVED